MSIRYNNNMIEHAHNLTIPLKMPNNVPVLL